MNENYWATGYTLVILELAHNIKARSFLVAV